MTATVIWSEFTIIVVISWFALLKIILICLLAPGKGKKVPIYGYCSNYVFPCVTVVYFVLLDAVCMDPKVSQYFVLESHVRTEPRRDMAGFWGILHRETSRTI